MKTGDTTQKIFQSVWMGCAVVRKGWKGNGGFKRKKCQIKQDQINNHTRQYIIFFILSILNSIQSSKQAIARPLIRGFSKTWSDQMGSACISLNDKSLRIVFQGLIWSGPIQILSIANNYYLCVLNNWITFWISVKFTELFNSFFVFRGKSKTFLDNISVQQRWIYINV